MLPHVPQLLLSVLSEGQVPLQGAEPEFAQIQAPNLQDDPVGHYIMMSINSLGDENTA